MAGSATPRFKDATGRDWAVCIPNFGTVKRLRTECPIDLNLVGSDSHALAKLILFGDAEGVLATVWALVKDQRAGVSYEQFCDVIDSASLDAARTALTEAICLFFHPQMAQHMLAEFNLLRTPNLSGSNEPAAS